MIAFSKELRIANGDQWSGVTDAAIAGSIENADLRYLEEKQLLGWPKDLTKTFISVGNISDFIMKSTDEYLKKYNIKKNFINYIMEDVRTSFAAQAAAAAATPAAFEPAPAAALGTADGGGGAGGGGHAAPPTPPPPPPAAPAAAADGSPGGGAGAGVVKPEFIDSAAGVVGAVITSTLPVASNLMGRIIGGDDPLIAFGSASGEIVDAGSVGWNEGILGGGVQNAYKKTAQAGAIVPLGGDLGLDPGAPNPPVDAAADGGHEGGGPGGAAPPPLTDAAAAAKAAAAAAQPNPVADDEERKKLKSLLAANPEARLEVFDEDDEKKKKQNNILETLLKNEPNYKKNKDSAFICFISPSDNPNANSTPLPYVTNGDFLKILAKNSFAKDSNKGIRICKMDLDPSDKGVVMGCSILSEQHWIDVKDEKNTTRIFIDKENFQKLADYKKLLTAKFEEFLYCFDFLLFFLAFCFGLGAFPRQLLALKSE